MPFSNFIDYLSLERNYSPHTITAYKKDLESFLIFASEGYGYENIKEVNYSIIRSWIISLVDTNISNRTVNRKVSSLKSYYKFLLKTSQIEINPLAGHKALKTSKKIQIPFSEVEIENVLESLESETHFSGVRDKLIVELFYSTG
ncbi:MAG: integrase/recombinase XerC, partial [Ulvibacter sp.]